MKKTNKIASKIDHTVLGPTVKKADIERICREAKTYDFASVCIPPIWVEHAKSLLQKTPHIQVCTVIGFPHGNVTTEVKQLEAQQAVENGATEIDMVISIAHLQQKEDAIVEKDIRAVVDAVREKAIVKVIIETGVLTDEEIDRACHCAKRARAHFVKTSTGFSTGGATISHVRRMKEIVGPHMGVKASGGIRDYETALQFVEAGATRIGASAGVAIAKKELQRHT